MSLSDCSSVAADGAAGSKRGARVPREILVWLQSLNLSRMVRNPKRDLSNGYMVAEICSRYWPSVSMHSFGNKMSAINKRSNWDLLVKVFAKNEVPLSDKMVDGVIASREKYAESFLRQLYTVLTGREVRDALPISAVEVQMEPYNPGGFAQQMKSTMEAYQHLHEGSDTDDDVVGGRASGASEDAASSSIKDAQRPAGTQKLADLPTTRRDSTRTVSTGNPKATVQPIRGAHAVEEEEVGALQGEDGRSKFVFHINVRAAEKSSTVQSIAPVSSSAMMNASATDAQRRMSELARRRSAIHDPSVGALEWVEHIVKGHANGWRLTPEYPLYISYFLGHEQDLESSVQNAIWGALLSRIGDLVESAHHDSLVLPQLIRAFLLSGKREVVGGGGGGPGSIAASSITNSPGVGVGMSASGAVLGAETGSTSPRVFVFLSALLSHLTDLEPHYALNAFSAQVLGCAEVKLVLQRLDYPTAELYASLLCAVISTDRPTANELLPDLLSATYECIMEDGSMRARCSFLVLLRAMMVRLIRLPRSTGSGGNGGSGGGGYLPEGSLHNILAPDEEDPLNASIYAIGTFNAVSSLSSSSPMLRLMGAALAVTLVQKGCPLQATVEQFLPLLFPVGASLFGEGPDYNAMRAMWLRCVQRRVCLQRHQYDGHTTLSLAQVEEDHGPLAPLVEEGGPAAQRLLHVFHDFCEYLHMSGGHMAAKTIIAYEMACALEFIPITDAASGSTSAEEVADAVLRFYALRATKEFQAMAVAPPSEASGGKSSNNNNNNSAGGGAGGRGVRGCVWPHVLLGPLCTPEMVRRTSAVLLCGALPRVFPVSEDPKEANRRLNARASALARERVVGDHLRLRSEWLYHLIVGGRGHDCLSPICTPYISRDEMNRRWREVLQSNYEHIALITMAAEVLYRQGSRVEEDERILLILAGKLQNVVLRWFVELPREIVVGDELGETTGNMNLTARRRSTTAPHGVGVSEEDTQEKMGAAMAWYMEKFGGDKLK